MPALAMSKNIILRHALRKTVRGFKHRVNGLTCWVGLTTGAFPLVAAAPVSAERANVSTSLTPDTGRLVVEVQGLPAPAPLFFSANVDQSVLVGAAAMNGTLRVKLRVMQGRPETLTLGLSGDGDVIDVSGKNVRDWAVRRDERGRRFLDLRTGLPAVTTANASPQELEVIVRTRLTDALLPRAMAVLILTPGDAVGFASKVTLQPEASIDLRVISAAGLSPLNEPSQFFSIGEARLEVQLARRGATAAEAALFDAQMTGKADPAAGSVEFRLQGQLRAQKSGARLRLLSGRAALSDQTTGEGWHIEWVERDGGQPPGYDLVADREGIMAFELTFSAAVLTQGEWRALDFVMPAGAVVPLRLHGWGDDVSFKTDLSVVPTAMSASTGSSTSAKTWTGFLPADGSVSLGWKRTPQTKPGTLAFTSSEQTDVRISAGVGRQTSQIAFRILQGKLSHLRCRVDGAGEILSVEGPNVISWKVVPGEGFRTLDVRFSQPMESQGQLVIQGQAELAAWPAQAEPMRLTPEGGVRHSGMLRVANGGAVKIEVVDSVGLMQLASTQFPGAAIEKEARQVFVYRFPSANYRYRVLATKIQPEVAVAAIVKYELAETVRVIHASLELDVREASIRDWNFRVPEDYTVVALSGNQVSDYVAEGAVENGTRAVRVLFGRPIEGRQLLLLRLEKNQVAEAGDWLLPALRFPGAKSVRGHVGTAAMPGYRLVPASTERLVEVPPSFFPQQTASLQQAWRVREPDWAATVRVEALGQSIQADVFHLYAIKEGVVTSSVLLNYFVVGAPANEWRIEVPAAVGNIDVMGLNVRRDWRREGDQLIVSLHQPVLGAATVLLTFAQPMSARGGVISPGQVRPLGVQGERGFLHVVSPLQVKSEVRHAEGGLLKLEPLELPPEFRLFTSAPSLAVYQYTARPFTFEMKVEPYAAGETVDQVVDFATLSSQVSRDGEVVTEAKYFVKTRGHQALRLTLPADVKLWEARVDNEVVTARTDGALTLVPLPARLNPNDPVVVGLRFGQAAGKNGSTVNLAAPRMATASTVINAWNVRSDVGRLLVPQSGNAELLRPALTETGFEWLSTRARGVSLVTLMLLGLGVCLQRGSRSSSWRTTSGLAACGLAMGGALLLMVAAWVERRDNLHELIYAVPMVTGNENITLRVANVPEWRALVVGWGVAAILAGAGLLITGTTRRRGKRRFTGLLGDGFALAGVGLIAGGLLAQHGGAVLFFAAMSGMILWRIFVPGVNRWRQERRMRLAETILSGAEPTSGAAPVLSWMVGMALTGLVVAGVQPSHAASTVSEKAAQSVVQQWTIRGERLFAEADVVIRGVPGDSFLLLRSPAVLTDFRAEGLRVSKVERDGGTAYFAVPERAGLLMARVRFEVPLPDRTSPIELPTGPGVVQRVTVELDQGGWEIVSPMAVQVRVTADLGPDRSGATLVLAPQVKPIIQFRPKQRDVGAEATQFFAETANLYIPSPGVINGVTRITVRPAQGRVSALELEIPKGLTVGEVGRGPIGAWRFDSETRRLHLVLEPAQTSLFKFNVETQLGAGELPFALALEPLRVISADGEMGVLALAVGGDAQLESIRASDLSAVSVADFDSDLLPRGADGQPVATVQNVWRYGSAGGRVELKVVPVAPEVRAASRQVLSIDEERLLMAVELKVAIMRVGLFKLTFELPAGLELETLTGTALNHWTEAQDGDHRLVTLHLNGRTLGEHTFNLSLTGPAPRAQAAWAFPRFLIREATRPSAEVMIVPGKGMRLRAGEREKATPLDPRELGGVQSGTLAFRLLEDDWVLNLEIEMLEAWVTVQALQEVALREGQTFTRVGLRYRVENAAIKSARIRLPGLKAESLPTVRATGSAVSDMVQVADATDTWEIRFQRGMAGETDVQIEFQSPPESAGGRETIIPLEFLGVRQIALWAVVRTTGRLEVEPGQGPRGWSRVDWSSVPTTLQRRSDRSVPALCFRVAEPEGPFLLAVRRHGVAEALKLRVTQGNLLTVLAPTGASMTVVELNLEVMEKSTLRVRLPEGTRLYNTFVNGESVMVVREGQASLFYVAPPAAGERTAVVRLVYAVEKATRGPIALRGPGFNVPLENVSWRVVLPPGYDLDDYSGELRLREEWVGGSFDADQYMSVVDSKRALETKEAMTMLQQAGAWLQKGEQEKAATALSRVSNANLLDLASNEDARVQLHNLKTTQAVLGLNTRRQRLYFEHRADTTRNAQLEQAATLNPFMQGKASFDPQQADQLLLGNTAEENAALRSIAARMVDQQLGGHAAPVAVDVTLRERGHVLVFTRSLQVNGGAPLELRLELAKIAPASFGLGVVWLLGLLGIAAWGLMRKGGVEAI